MQQHRLQRVLTFCLLLLVLAACGQEAAPAPQANVPTSVGGRVTLVLWHGWPMLAQRALGRLVDRYNQSHPNIRVIPQAMSRSTLPDELRTAAASGSGPHLVLIPSHWLGILAEENLLLPLNGKVSPAELDLLLPAAVGSSQVVDTAVTAHLYGLPVTFDTPVLYYNRDNVLVAPANTESLLRIARGLTDTGAQQPTWGLAYNLSLDKTIGYMYAFGGQVLNKQGGVVLGSSGRSGIERWLAWMLELQQDQQLLAAADGIRIDGALKAQQALMTMDWGNQIGAYRALWGDRLGVAPLPQLSATGVSPAAYVQSEVVSINTRVQSGDEQAAALDFSRYLISEEVQRELLEAELQPTLMTLKLDSDGPIHMAARAFREQATHGHPIPNSRAEVEIIWPALVQMLRSVLHGQLNPADAVTQADARLRASLAQPSTP